MERRNFVKGAAGIPLAIGLLFGMSKVAEADDIQATSKDLPQKEMNPLEELEKMELPIDFGNGFSGICEGVFVDKNSKVRKIVGTFDNGMLTAYELKD